MARRFFKYIFIFLLLGYLNILSAQNSLSYDDLIISADSYFAKNDFYNAKTTYQLALQIDNNAEYPKNRIEEIIQKLNDELELRLVFEEKLQFAQEAYADQEYQKAILLYKEASAIIDYEEHPKQEVVRIEREWEALKTKLSNFDRLLIESQDAKQDQNYASAIDKMEEANRLFPSKSDVLNELSQLKFLSAQQSADLEEFNYLVNEGDKQLEQNRFQSAFKNYMQAAHFFENDSYVIKQLKIVREAIKIEEAYNIAVERADALYIALELEEAKKAYKEAEKIWPEKTYPGNMLAKLDEANQRKAVDSERLNSEFEAKIASADAQFRSQKYAQAYDLYIKALDLKPEESYPQKQLREINKLLANGYLDIECKIRENGKILADAFIEVIENGISDEIAITGNYILKLKLNSNYLLKFSKDGYIHKIFEIDTHLPDEEDFDAVYKTELDIELFKLCAIDLSVFDKPLAKIVYKQSAGKFTYDLSGTEAVNRRAEQLKDECARLFAEEKKIKEYERLIAEAESFKKAENYSSAISSYQNALKIFPEKGFATEQILILNALIKENEEYDQHITAGDSKYTTGKLNEALFDYYKAKNLKPKATYPQEKISEIDGILAIKNSEDIAYRNQLHLADSLFDAKSWAESISFYVKAIALKKDEMYPQARLSEAEQLLTAQNKLDANYREAIRKADDLFESQSFSEARASYREANRIKPEEEYPLYKIEDINTIVAQHDIIEINNRYSMLITSADQHYSKNAYQISLSHYKRAADLKPNEAYPQQQIEKIDQILEKQKDFNIKYRRIIKSADSAFYLDALNFARTVYMRAKDLKPMDDYPPAQINKIDSLFSYLNDLNLNYKNAIVRADISFVENKYLNAKEDYNLALTFRPLEDYPKQKIKEIDALLSELHDLEQNYMNAIDRADISLAGNQYESARSDYILALTFKPKEDYPTAQINKIDAILIDLRDLEQNYQNTIAIADVSFTEKQYGSAKANYNLALTYKPSENYPKQKIKEIDAIIAQMNALEAAYQTSIKIGDRNFLEENYLIAKSNFKEALRIKENEEYPKSKIADIESILAKLGLLDLEFNEIVAKADVFFDAKEYSEALPLYVKAHRLKLHEVYPSEQIALIKQIMAMQIELDGKYRRFIKSADSAFFVDELSFARGLYIFAKDLKPKQVYPPAQINKIDALLSDLRDLEQNYQNTIARANVSFAEKQYSSAKADYNLALTYKPSENYPKQKIKEIDALIAQMNALEAAYQKAIELGDRKYETENYLSAIINFKEALKIKENEEYPKLRIAAIESILAKLDQIDKAYKLVIAKADGYYGSNQYSDALPYYKEAKSLKPNEVYPPDQIYRINQFLNEQLLLDKAYADALIKADKFYHEQQYLEAKSPYQKANRMKPSESYPKEQLAKINDLLEISDREYQAFIKQGDDAYRMVIYQDAIVAYENALGIFPDESYPKMMLDKIDAKIRRETVVVLVSSSETISIGEEKRYTFAPIDFRDRQNNYILIEMKSNSDERMRVFINFGEDGIKKGGYSVNLVKRDGYTKYFIRIDRQLRWQREDNNWISILPEGGDLEVNRIQISREETSN